MMKYSKECYNSYILYSHVNRDEVSIKNLPKLMEEIFPLNVMRTKLDSFQIVIAPYNVTN